MAKAKILKSPDPITVQSKHVREVVEVANQLEALLIVIDSEKYFDAITLLDPLKDTLAVIAETWEPLIEEDAGL